MVGTVSMVDLRLLGVGILRRQPVSQVASQFLPWTWAGFCILFISGSFLLISEAATRAPRGVAAWLSLAIWADVVFAGRGIAYY